MADVDAIADELFTILNTGRQIEPYSRHHPDFSLADAYRATDLIRRKREAAGERPIGRKIGFTNRTIWEQYQVYAPIWGFVYDRTVRKLADFTNGFSLTGLAEPLIEPEIIFHFRSIPSAGMDERAILGCVDWVSHGFEIVQSVFPGWKFAPADTVAAYGLHGALFVGATHPVAGSEDEWLRKLASFEIDLYRDGAHIDHGHAANVLDSPVSALRHLIALLAEDKFNPPLGAGEIVTTGTLTKAMPIAAGQKWSTKLTGIELEGAKLNFK
jgi:2-oxo-3-hexenedioate decarboxylase